MFLAIVEPIPTLWDLSLLFATRKFAHLDTELVNFRAACLDKKYTKYRQTVEAFLKKNTLCLQQALISCLSIDFPGFQSSNQYRQTSLKTSLLIK